MNPSKNIKLVFFVPETHADIVRQALGTAGAGKIGNYSFCSFSTKGIGRFIGEEGSNPAIGEVGKLEAVQEEKIEVICSREIASKVIKAVRAVHPYEEMCFDAISLEDI